MDEARELAPAVREDATEDSGMLLVSLPTLLM
jgi:hypothetical protein